MKPLTATLGIASALIASAICFAAEEKPVRDVKPLERTRDRYRILSSRNIFDKSRRPYRERPDYKPPPPKPPEHYLVLRGIFIQGDDFIAFIENTRGGSEKVKIGGKIADGGLKSITIDAIEFEKDGETITVKIGQTLDGGQAPAIARSTPTATPTEPKSSDEPDKPETSGEASATSTPPSSDGMSMLERLKQARLKELKEK